MKTLAFKVIDRLFIVVYGASSPSEEDWIAYIRAVEQNGAGNILQLIYTEGGSPTPRQKEELDIMLAGRSAPVAVISNRRRVRVRVRLAAWFNRQIKAFPMDRLGMIDALSFLGIQEGRFEMVDEALSRLILSVRLAA